MPKQHDVAQAAGAVDDRHFNGFNTRLLVQYLQVWQPEGTLEVVLAGAGEHRPVEVLTDDASWSSYDQFRRLLESTADVIGRDQLQWVAPMASRTGDAPDSVGSLQELGSPASVLHEGVLSGASMGASAIVEATSGEPLGDDGYRMSLRLASGFEPFPALCAWNRGLLAVVPTVFGLPPGDVTEDVCACTGAPACQFTVRWQASGSPEEQVGALQVRVQVLQERLDAVEAMVAELVSSPDMEKTLAHIADTAARTLRVPAHALVLDGAGVGPTVRVVGTSPEAALAALADADPDGEHDVLVVPVTSARGTFGRLALLEPGRVFRPHERQSLLSYARLTAAALDSAAALEEARRQAGTARALLHLSTALGQVLTTDEMATVLARAVPDVIDCDRAMVVLGDPDTGTARIAGAHGYPDELLARFRTARIRLHLERAAYSVQVLQLDELERTDDSAGAALMRATGSPAVAVVPVLVDGRITGHVVASVVDRPERLAATADLEERLWGIAALGATALRNGVLVDAIHHRATHDTLTDLPNRALILDRLHQLLGRRGQVSPVAVLYLDLDGFKVVNDTAGHEAGDRLLRAAADRMRAAVRRADTVGRMGGDEFVVLVVDADADHTPEKAANRLLAQFEEPFAVGGRSYRVTASIGIAVATTGGADDLLRQADAALYRAKSAGKARAVHFDPSMSVAGPPTAG